IDMVNPRRHGYDCICIYIRRSGRKVKSEKAGPRLKVFLSLDNCGFISIYIHMKSAQLARRMANECPATRVRQASRVLSKIFDDAFRPLGLQSSQLPVLCAVALSGEAGAPIGALARGLVMDPTTLTRNIRPLEKMGLVRVARAPDDARTRNVFLTS